MPKKAPAKKTTTKKTTKKKTSVKRSTPRIKNSVKGRKKQLTFGQFLIAICLIFLPLVVGSVSAALAGESLMNFGLLKQPSFTPSFCLFPVIWTTLYLLMGIALWLIYRQTAETPVEKNLKRTELILYFIQLVFNFCWPIFFFRLELRYFAFGWLVGLCLMIFTLIFMCFKSRKSAAWLLLPYLLWCIFSAYLNIMIALLN